LVCTKAEWRKKVIFFGNDFCSDKKCLLAEEVPFGTLKATRTPIIQSHVKKFRASQFKLKFMRSNVKINQYSILQTFYVQLLHQYSIAKKLQSQTLIREKLCKTLFVQKSCL